MKMTHEELAAARDREDWKALWPEAETRANFSIEQVAHGATDKDGPAYDGDVCQVAHEAAWIAIQDWAPLEVALDTHIKMRVHGAISDFRRTERTGGIGSRRTVADGSPSDHISMATEYGADDDAEESPTYLDSLTYGDTDHVPQGYGDPAEEAGRETIDDTIGYFMHGLDPAEARLLRRYIMEDVTSRDYALQAGISHTEVQRSSKTILKKLFQKVKSCFVLGKGTANWKGLKSHYPVRKRYPHFWSDARGMFNANPIWSEATGKVWNNWAYVCEDPTQLPEMDTLQIGVPPGRRPICPEPMAVFYERRKTTAGAATTQAASATTGLVSGARGTAARSIETISEAA